jgi:hypothetical protein
LAIDALGIPRAGEGFPGLQSTRLGEIDTKPVSGPLIAAGHYGRRMAKLLLHITLIDLGEEGEAGPQRMAGELVGSLAGRLRSTIGSMPPAPLFIRETVKAIPDSIPGPLARAPVIAVRWADLSKSARRIALTRLRGLEQFSAIGSL